MMRYIIAIMITIISSGKADSWLIRLGVQNDDLSYLDLYNEFGVSPTANDEYGVEDFINLLSPEPHYIDLYFPHDDSDRVDYWEPPNNAKYSIDIRNDATIVHNFYFDIFCNTTGTQNVAIFWVEEDSVPPSYLVKISPIHDEGINIFLGDTLRQTLSPGIYYFVATTKKNAFERISISPDPLFLRIGESAHIYAYLVGDEDTLKLSNLDWNLWGESATFDEGIVSGITEGISYISACFRGWCDTTAIYVSGTGIPVQIHLETGWNLISLPVEPATNNAGAIFGDFSENMYKFDDETQEYIRMRDITTGEGFFILSYSDTNIYVYGAPILSIDRELSEGWHILGCPIIPVPKSHIHSEPGHSFLPEIYGYEETGYFRADTLLPGKGYWFFQIFRSEIHIH